MTEIKGHGKTLGQDGNGQEDLNEPSGLLLALAGCNGQFIIAFNGNSAC